MSKETRPLSLTGVVTARTCPTCGHHEIGLLTEEGVFYPLTPGTRVSVTDETAAIKNSKPVIPPLPVTTVSGEEKRSEEGHCWVPEPLLADRTLRLKYGVFLPKEAGVDMISEETYESAYLKKLLHLVENAEFTTLAVVLDQFFSAPYLASGEPGDVVMNMWRDLEEIREPVELMKQWLEAPGEKTLQTLTGNRTMESNAINEKAFKEELTGLDLETFLELL